MPTLRKYPILLPEDTSLFFLSGSMKSGTTWLMNVLNAHPEIGCIGEMHAVETLDFRPPVPTLESAAFNSHGLKEWYTMPNSSWNLPYRADGKKDMNLREMEKDYVRFFFEWSIVNYYSSTGQPLPRIIGDKSPAHTVRLINKLNYFFKSAYSPFVLHIVRDPRDVAVSSWFHMRKKQYNAEFDLAPGFLDKSDEQSCRELIEKGACDGPLFKYEHFLKDVFSEWAQVNGSLYSLGREFFKDRYLLVRYEDLKTGLKASLKSVLGFLGADGSDAIVDEIADVTDISRAMVKPDVFRKGSVGGFRAHFTENDMSTYRKIARETAGMFGYED